MGLSLDVLENRAVLAPSTLIICSGKTGREIHFLGMLSQRPCLSLCLNAVIIPSCPQVQPPAWHPARLTDLPESWHSGWGCMEGRGAHHTNLSAKPLFLSLMTLPPWGDILPNWDFPEFLGQQTDWLSGCRQGPGPRTPLLRDLSSALLHVLLPSAEADIGEEREPAPSPPSFPTTLPIFKPSELFHHTTHLQAV